jgi:uncharacterized cupredoxin-like copper-binding protein
VTDRGAVRPGRPLRRAAPWLIAAVLLAAVGLPAAAGSFGRLPTAPSIGYAQPQNATTVVVNLTDTPRFLPPFLSAPAGGTTTFHLVNRGVFVHTFTLLDQSGVRLNSSWTPTQVDRYFAQNGSLANVSIPAGGQANATVAFNASTAFDTFEYVSVIPYQFQAGMAGVLNITSTAPGLRANDTTTDSLSFVPGVLVANDTHYPFNLDVLVTNTGNDAHTFTIEAQANNTLSPANFTTYFQAHPPLASVPVPSGAGSTVWANFTVPGPGIFQYICEITGHFAAGMTGYLYVDTPVPAMPGPPSTAIVEGWVLVGSAVLLGIGIGVAAAVTYAGRFPGHSEEKKEHP